MKLPLASLLLASLACHAYEADIILDDSTAGAVELVGPWSVDATTTNALRGGAQVIESTTANAAEYARFSTPDLGSAGPWQVFVWHNGRSGFGTSVAYTVENGAAALSTTNATQAANAAQWLLVGTFWFEGQPDAGNPANTVYPAALKIAHNSTGKLSADAVRFSPATPWVTLDADSIGNGVTCLPSTAPWTYLADKSAWLGLTRRAQVPASGTPPRVEFRPVVQAAGQYDVAIWLPRKTGGSAATSWLPAGGVAVDSVHVKVHHRNGVLDTTVALPSGGGQHEGGWVRVGTESFAFTKHSATTVTKIEVIADGTAGQWVPADAVRLTLVGGEMALLDNTDPAYHPVNHPENWDLKYSGTWEDGATFGPRSYGYYVDLPIGSGRWRTYGGASPGNVIYRVPDTLPIGSYHVFGFIPRGNRNTIHANFELGLWTAGSFAPLESLNNVNTQTQNGMWRQLFSLYATSQFAVRYTIPAQDGDYLIADGLMVIRDPSGDVDGDGLLDSWEWQWWTSLSMVGTDNPDDDDWDNEGEETNQTNPNDGPPVITVTSPAGASVVP